MTTKGQVTEAAEASEAEAVERVRVLSIGEGDGAVTVQVPRKFKRLKFMRALRAGDMAGALDAIWPPTPILDAQGEPVMGPLGPLVTPHPEAARLEDADLDEEEFQQVFTLLASAMGVETEGNS
jgi:hypothetical protein